MVEIYLCERCFWCQNVLKDPGDENSKTTKKEEYYKSNLKNDFCPQYRNSNIYVIYNIYRL